MPAGHHLVGSPRLRKGDRLDRAGSLGAGALIDQSVVGDATAAAPQTAVVDPPTGVPSDGGAEVVLPAS